ncbi:hypothetical protein ILUMI_13321 [Ignelater luminosus]|uniref:Uncharacterized protein n=1 Tax=Ignelater luminosus TaxID=2038154 RepID=A0A8K0D119_IGNLU|nr:hypothetical protein ILUMI_13321 [Ignelater luminosus]
MRGIDNYKVKEINYNPETLIFSTKMEFDDLPFYTMYEMSGRLLHIPIEGKGFQSVTFLGPMNPTIRIEGELVEVDGVEYYNTTNVKVTESIKDMEVTLQGLFGGDEELGRITNHLLNRFSVEIMQAITKFNIDVSEIVDLAEAHNKIMKKLKLMRKSYCIGSKLPEKDFVSEG